MHIFTITLNLFSYFYEVTVDEPEWYEVVVDHVSFLTGQNIENTYFEEFTH